MFTSIISYISCVISYIITWLLSFRRRSEKSSLKSQITEYRKELAKISQTDEFARYSKVQRRLRATSDKLDSIIRQDTDTQFWYVIIAQAITWPIVILLLTRLMYYLYALAVDYILGNEYM